MRGVRRAAWAIVAAIAGLAGAALAGACTDLGGLSGGTPGAADAGTDGAPVADGAADDARASSDGQPSRDAASVGDDDAFDGGSGVSDARDAADGALPFACDGTRALCDTFDLPETLGSVPNWTLKDTGGGLIAITDAGFFSPPNALAARSDPNGPPDQTPLVSRTFSGNARSVRCELQYRIDGLPQAGQNQALFVLSVTQPGYSEYTWTLSAAPSGVGWVEHGQFADGGVAVDQSRDMGPPALGVWYHVALELDALTLTYGYMPPNSPKTLNGDAQMRSNNTSQIATFGFLDAPAIDGGVLLDDVACDVIPF